MNKKFKFCETPVLLCGETYSFLGQKGERTSLVPSPFESYYLIKDLFSCTPSLVSQTL